MDEIELLIELLPEYGRIEMPSGFPPPPPPPPPPPSIQIPTEVLVIMLANGNPPVPWVPPLLTRAAPQNYQIGFSQNSSHLKLKYLVFQVYDAFHRTAANFGFAVSREWFENTVPPVLPLIGLDIVFTEFDEEGATFTLDASENKIPGWLGFHVVCEDTSKSPPFAMLGLVSDDPQIALEGAG